MENIIKAVTSSNLYLSVAIILGAFILYSIVKKVIKMALISLVIIIIYVTYLFYTGEKIPQTREEVVDHVSEKIREGARKGRELLEKKMGNIKVKDIK
jgi:ABC-type bacteriocin/lantibiotic exporter with double-glycine peptidase domain